MKDKIYLDRILKQIILTDDQWDQLLKDFENGETKGMIKAKYGLNNFQFKYLKKYIYGGIDG